MADSYEIQEQINYASVYLSFNPKYYFLRLII